MTKKEALDRAFNELETARLEGRPADPSRQEVFASMPKTLVDDAVKSVHAAVDEMPTEQAVVVRAVARMIAGNSLWIGMRAAELMQESAAKPKQPNGQPQE